MYSLSQNRVLQALKGGAGSITAGTWAGTKAVLSTSAGVVKVFESSEEYASFTAHAGEVTALALHPCGDILASVGVDKSYVLYDLEAKSVLTQVYSNSGLCAVTSFSYSQLTCLVLSCAQFHPDGHLLAAGGQDGEIKIFDVKSGTQAATFDLGGQVKSIYFSENGTWLAAIRHDSTSVSIWDLRKSNEIRSLDVGGLIEAISWDYTGQFLVAVGPSGVVVDQYSKSTKEWTEILKNAIPAVAVAWGQAAQSIVMLGDDGAVTTLAAQEA